MRTAYVNGWVVPMELDDLTIEDAIVLRVQGVAASQAMVNNDYKFAIIAKLQHTTFVSDWEVEGFCVTEADGKKISDCLLRGQWPPIYGRVIETKVVPKDVEFHE